LFKDKLLKIIPQELLDEACDKIQIKLGTVSREEFDVKCKLLDKIEKQLNTIEYTLAEIKSKRT
jgi:BMFP domain-containing protein YqiC